MASELTSENEEEEEEVAVEKGDEKLRCVSVTATAMYRSEYLCRQAMSIH